MSLWMESLSVTIQMKATEQYFPVVLFIMLYTVVLVIMKKIYIYGPWHDGMILI